jgi:Tol biopolymer transport system component/DNA-binding winged helix-turn-helix (wHTH) protein
LSKPVNSNQNWRFGVYEVDVPDAELRRDGKPIKLREQSFRILVYLLEHSGEIVTREDLRQILWPSDTFVDFDHSLNTAVMKLRDALGDSADAPLYIETIPKRGYRFIAPISQPEDVESGRAHSITDSASAPPSQQAGNSRGRSKKLLFPALAIAVLVLVAAGWIIERSLTGRSLLAHRAKSGADRSPSSRLRTVPLTNLPGEAWDPAFSPDARQIAFLWDGENPGRGDLYVQLVGGDKPLRLTYSKAGFLGAPVWSPDGREIAFARCDDNGGAVFVVPALGGPERMLTDVACGPLGDAGYPNWTSDGKSMVLADRCTPDGPRGVVVFSLETGEKRCLTAPPAGNVGDSDPVLSPDQKTVAFIRGPTTSVCDIYTVAFAGGNLRRLTDENRVIWRIMWAPEGQSISFRSTRIGPARRISAAGGAIEPETVYPDVGALSRDGRRLAYVEPPEFWRSSAEIWRVQLSSAGGQVLGLKQMLSSANVNNAPQPSPDGRQIVFGSVRSGVWEIWKSNEDGTDLLQLTSFGGHAGTPRWSPDGKWIAFDYRPEAHSQTYLIDVEGRNLHMVTSGNYENLVPSWSRDGTSIYFASNRTGDWQVWRRDLATGSEAQVTRHGGFAAFESYDAKTLYFSKFNGGGIWSVPTGGGEEKRITDALHLGYWGHFAVTEAGLYLVDSDAEPGPTIKYYNFQTRRLTPILTLKQDPLPFTANLAASRDGRTVFFVQGESKSSMVMVEYLQ